MKFLKKIFHTWFICLVLCGWALGASKLFTLPFEYLNYAITFVIAPISETLFYLYLPFLLAVKLDERFNINLRTPFMVFAGFMFVLLHDGNYMFGGRYFACLFQGAMFYACYVLLSHYWQKGGFWLATITHIKYNLFIAFVLPTL